MKDKNHGKADDNDQWITNPKVFKQIFNLYGISKKNMNDLTPLNAEWCQWTCWNAVEEILRLVFWWMNHPWGKH
jgi:hypothetical protein